MANEASFLFLSLPIFVIFPSKHMFCLLKGFVSIVFAAVLLLIINTLTGVTWNLMRLWFAIPRCLVILRLFHTDFGCLDFFWKVYIGYLFFYKLLPLLLFLFRALDKLWISVIVEGCLEHMHRSEKLKRISSLFHHAGLKGQTHAVRLGSKDRHQPRHLISPIAYSLNCTGAFSSGWSFLSALAITSSDTGVLSRK